MSASSRPRGLLPVQVSERRWRMDPVAPGGYILTFTVTLPRGRAANGIACLSVLVFSGQRYYPGPAWEDMRGACSTMAAARALLAERRTYGLDWYQIIDVTTLTVLESGTFDGPDEFGEDNWVFTEHTMDKWTRFMDRQSQESATP